MSSKTSQIITLLGSIDLSLRKLVDATDRRAANRTRAAMRGKSHASFRKYNPKFDRNGPCYNCPSRERCTQSCRDLDVFKAHLDSDT